MPTQVRIGWRSGSSSQTATSIVTSGLILNLDAGNTTSYSGTGTTWTDLSSTGNNGTLTNGTAYSSGYLTFDGVNDYVDMGNNTAYNLINLSVSSWFRPTVGGNNYSPVITRYYNITPNNGWMIYYHKPTSKIHVEGRESGAQYLSLVSNNTYSINNWYNITWTKSGNTWSLYVNGTLDKALTLGNGTTPITSNNMHIGCFNPNDPEYAKQDVGTVNIYNRVLSASEITQNFDATKTRFGYSTLDTDVQAFVTAASITDATQVSAVNTLVTSLKSAGIWTKMRALYPFVGGTAASHKFNLKDPRDLDAAYRLVFNGGWVHSSTGAQPNGSNTYANTYFNPTSQSLSISSQHLSYYSRTNIIENAVEIGVISSTNVNFLGLYVSSTSGTRAGLASSVRYNNSVVVDTRGLFVATRTDTSNIKVHVNGSIQASQSAPSTGNDNFPMYIGAYGALTPDLFSTKEAAFASIGDGLTDTEAANFYNAVQTFQTTLGRQVGVPIVADTDAQAFLNAAIITDSTQASAVNTLVTSLKTAGIWTKMKALYPFVGGNATSHKFNLKDPRDLDAAFRLVFNGGMLHSNLGIVPNGTNSYADTRLNPTGTLSLNSAHISVYINDYGNGVLIGSDQTYRFWISPRFGASNERSAIFINESAFNYGSSSINKGLWLGSRINSSFTKLYNNSTVYSNPSYGSVALENGKIFIAARATGVSTADVYFNKPISFSSIGDGLTDSEATAFYNAVQAFQTTLGRQV